MLLLLLWNLSIVLVVVRFHVADGHLFHVFHRRRGGGGRGGGARNDASAVAASRVNAHVTRDHVASTRGVGTFGTLVRFLARVRALMSVEMIAARENLAGGNGVGGKKRNKGGKI